MQYTLGLALSISPSRTLPQGEATISVVMSGLLSACAGFYDSTSHKVPLILAAVSRPTAVSRLFCPHTLAPGNLRISCHVCTRGRGREVGSIAYLSCVTPSGQSTVSKSSLLSGSRAHCLCAYFLGAALCAHDRTCASLFTGAHTFPPEVFTLCERVLLQSSRHYGSLTSAEFFRSGYECA